MHWERGPRLTAEAQVTLDFTKARKVSVPAVDPDDQHIHRDDLRSLWALHQAAYFAVLETQVLDFIADRAKFILRERDKFGYDEVNAVFWVGADDLVDAGKRLAALKSIRKSKNFEPLAVSFKRIRNILEKSNFKAEEGSAIQTDLFENSAERELFSAGRAVNVGDVEALMGLLERRVVVLEMLQSVLSEPAVHVRIGEDAAFIV